MSKGWIKGGPTGNDVFLDLGVLFIRVEEEVKDSGLFFGIIHSGVNIFKSRTVKSRAEAITDGERKARKLLADAIKTLDGLGGGEG